MGPKSFLSCKYKQKQKTESELHFYSTDFDECQLATPPCGQLCNNTVGSFMCACRDGYRLENNGRTCAGECFNSVVQLHEH